MRASTSGETLNPRRVLCLRPVSQPRVESAPSMEAPDGKSEDLRSAASSKNFLVEAVWGESCRVEHSSAALPPAAAVHLKLHPAQSAEQQLLLAAERRARLAETQAAEAAEELRQL